MSATGFFHDNPSERDNTIVRDEPVAGLETPDSVWDRKFFTLFQPGSETHWLTVDRELVEDLDGRWR